MFLYYCFSIQVKSRDPFLVAVESARRDLEEPLAKYEISVVGTHNDSFKDVAVEFKSTITDQKILVYVTFSGKFAKPCKACSLWQETKKRRIFVLFRMEITKLQNVTTLSSVSHIRKLKKRQQNSSNGV